MFLLNFAQTTPICEISYRNAFPVTGQEIAGREVVRDEIYCMFTAIKGRGRRLVFSLYHIISHCCCSSLSKRKKTSLFADETRKNVEKKCSDRSMEV